MKYKKNNTSILEDPNTGHKMLAVVVQILIDIALLLVFRGVGEILMKYTSPDLKYLYILFNFLIATFAMVFVGAEVPVSIDILLNKKEYKNITAEVTAIVTIAIFTAIDVPFAMFSKSFVPIRVAFDFFVLVFCTYFFAVLFKDVDDKNEPGRY